jgi:hypothetical protein
MISSALIMQTPEAGGGGRQTAVTLARTWLPSIGSVIVSPYFGLRSPSSVSITFSFGFAALKQHHPPDFGFFGNHHRTVLGLPPPNNLYTDARPIPSVLAMAVAVAFGERTSGTADHEMAEVAQWNCDPRRADGASGDRLGEPARPVVGNDVAE